MYLPHLPKPGTKNRLFRSEIDQTTGSLLLYIKNSKIKSDFEKQGFEINSPMFTIEKDYWMYKENIDYQNAIKNYEFIYQYENEIWIPNYVITRLQEIESLIIKPNELNRVLLLAHNPKKDLKKGVKEYELITILCLVHLV
jgi:hypothetical protein